MRKITLKDRLRYAFDNTLSRGPSGLLLWLGILSVLIVGLVSLSAYFLRFSDKSWLEIAWMSMLRTLDPGTMGGDQGEWPFLISMLVVTIGGIFIISSLIGILTTGLENKLDTLRKGKSRVIEKNHTVILGWSEQIFTIISELVEANLSQRKSCIVIMGGKDKVEMEEELKARIKHRGRTRIVCRQGNPILLEDLEVVALDTAKSIIILAVDEDDPDSHVIKTILAITNAPGRRKEKYHLVAEIRDPRNYTVAKMVGKDEVEIILVGNLVARIIAQTCRQTGLSLVYTELLDFGGDEIYFTADKQLIGKTYSQILHMYEDSAVMGIFTQGKALLNPPMDTVVQDGDSLIVIAEDDSTIRLSKTTEDKADRAALNLGTGQKVPPEKTLILGWNRQVSSIIMELDNYVAPQSQVTIVAAADGAAQILKADCAALKNQSLHFIKGDTTDRRTLDSLDIAAYNHLILLSDSAALDNQKADARTIITLLHLRDIREKKNIHTPIVSEMLDIQNRNLAEVTRANDFIVSGKLISLLLAQISENKHLSGVFEDLFDPEGSEIYIKPVGSYLKTGIPVNFYTVLEAARQKNETAIGYRIAALAGVSAQGYGVVINPDKEKSVVFAPEDKIIVLAEN